MGKLLSFGPHLKYPITISKILKPAGQPVSKQEKLLQYQYKSINKVGGYDFEADPDRHKEVQQTLWADWDSPVDGTIESWRVAEGQEVKGDMEFLEVEEDCPHSVQYAGLCGMCGKDMTELGWAERNADTERAKINMIHDQTALRVSREEASKAEEETQRRLLKQRRLSLVVDLDQTIIHACIEPTVGEWQNDTSNPNHEAVKDVRSFQLNDDGPRGVASGCNYYIKMRPGLKDFLACIAEKYELHVYTMGTRAYALNIAKIVDPDKKLFGDRIISRDENGNMTAKSLARLFPENTKMVVIIDDRADVWPANRSNLIKVVPYDFFVGIGDINSSFLPKREELPKPVPPKKKPSKHEDAAKAAEALAPAVADEKEKEESKPADESKVSALEELVRMGGGDDQALRQEQTAEQEKFLEKQITDRPLLHMQEELEKEESESQADDDKDEPEKNGETSPEHHHQRHKILNDDDTELVFLEKHLSAVHKAFYDQYDGALVGANGGRVAQLKPGHTKKLSIKGNAAELQVVPDVAEVMPRLKEKTLEGCVIVMSGLVPLGVDLLRSEIALQAKSFGARIETRVSKKITHLVASTSRTRTTKVRQAARYPHVKIINQLWLVNSMSKWAKENETPYLVDVHDSDRAPPADSSNDSQDQDSEMDGPKTPNTPSDQEPPSSQDDDDDAGAADVMPDELEEGHSPIDDLKGFDWGGSLDELDEFVGSDLDSETDGESERENVSVSGRGTKRGREESENESEAGGGSKLGKRQATSKNRSTGLKTAVEAPSSESSLPTPEVTEEGEGEGEGEDEGARGVEETESSLGEDLEAELEAELERGLEEVWEEGDADADGGGGGG